MHFRPELLAVPAAAMRAVLLILVSLADPGVVYLIRHGEKTSLLGCLSAQGKARAAALPDVFSGRPSPRHELFRAPAAVFANNYNDPVNCERCLETVTPIAQALGLAVNHTSPYSLPPGSRAP